jgi:hypothetical protein
VVSNSSTVSLQDSGELFINSFSGNWREDFLPGNLPSSDWVKLWMKYGPVSISSIASSSTINVTATIVTDLTSTAGHKGGLDIRNLRWTTAEALETYLRLKIFEEDWNAPGMEGYDAL